LFYHALRFQEEELMELDAAEKLDKVGINRYEAVLAVAKYARRMNLERLREKSQGEDEDVETEKLPKIITQALKDVLEGRVEFERTKKT
jgi:DNA-directed RNA polymerase omega subunit